MVKAKVDLVHTAMGHYRHPLFEKLSKEVDLMVYYCSVNCRSRRWDLWPRNTTININSFQEYTLKSQMLT
jgi:hypothetical protein